MQPRVAWGRSLRTGPRKRAQPIARATVTSSLSCAGARALVDRGLGEAAGRRHGPEERLAAHDRPLARSSWSLSIGGSDLRRTARPTARVSRNTMMAMAKAPGSSCSRWSSEGTTGVGSPDGTGAMSATPCSSMAASTTSRMPPTTATSGPGPGGDPSQADQDGEGGGREGDRGPADIGEVVDDGPQLGDEVVGGRVLDAEQAGELPGGDRQPDPDLDAGQGGLGDVVDQHRAAAPGDQEDHADEQGQVARARDGSSLPAATPAASRSSR